MSAVMHRLLIIVIELPAPKSIAIKPSSYDDAFDGAAKATQRQPLMLVTDPKRYAILGPNRRFINFMAIDATNDDKNEINGMIAMCATLMALSGSSATGIAATVSKPSSRLGNAVIVDAGVHERSSSQSGM